MPKYWVKNYFAHGRFPEVGKKQKTEKKEEERLKVCNNNGQLRIANAHRVAHAKPPGPTSKTNSMQQLHDIILSLRNKLILNTMKIILQYQILLFESSEVTHFISSRLFYTER